MHEPGCKCPKGDELFAVQGFYLIGLQAAIHVPDSDGANLGAAGQELPELFASEAYDDGIFVSNDAESGGGFALHERRFTTAFTGRYEANDGDGAILLQAVCAELAFENDYIEDSRFARFNQCIAGRDVNEINLIVSERGPEAGKGQN